MRTALNRAFTGLFAVAISVFLLLAFTLVIAQVIGLTFVQPGLIVWGEEVLKQPSIIAAILTGLFGFLAFNTLQRSKPSPKDEED